MARTKTVNVGSTRIKGDAVRIDDLNDFIRDLRRLKDAGGPDGLKLLKQANYRVAAHVRDKAQDRAAGISRMHARAGADLKVSRDVSGAKLTGGSRVPWFNAAEFGVWLSARNQKGPKELGGRNGPNYATGREVISRGRLTTSEGWHAFAKYEWNEPGNGKTGYFLFPTMRAESAAIKEMYVRELDDICKIAFPNGRM